MVLKRRFGQRKIEHALNYLYWSGNIYQDRALMGAYEEVRGALRRYLYAWRERYNKTL